LIDPVNTLFLPCSLGIVIQEEVPSEREIEALLCLFSPLNKINVIAIVN